MICARVEMTGSASGPPITPRLHVPKQGFAENDKRGLVEHVTVYAGGRGWSNSLEGRKRWILPAAASSALCNRLGRRQQYAHEKQKSHLGMGSS